MTEAFKEVGRRVECLVVPGDDGDLAVGWIQPPVDIGLVEKPFQHACL